ncbi:MAG: rRNA maturation RNase YbeY [Chloroflexota bacterium]|nr:rRNA maturation RNase YbeY [Chloroflexota bacterium]
MIVRPGVELPVARIELGRAAQAALDAVGPPAPASIGLVLTDDRELSALNARYMGEERATDVLSFPLLRTGGAALAGEHSFVLPPGQRTHLGDVVVSVERAAVQARTGSGGQTGDVRWSVRDELRLLVVHGTLHVCGWDHALPQEEAAMRAVERRILAALGTGRVQAVSSARGSVSAADA